MSGATRTRTSRFEPGQFTPAPRAASVARMLSAQSRMELILLLRNGEQLLLTLFIPVTMLVGLCLLPISGLGESRADRFVPAIMTVAVMSTAFTGQAIAVGFDRRYGALKRLGATPLPRWGVIAGKSLAVGIVVVLQAVVLGLIGIAFGWSVTWLGLLLGAVAIAVGTLAFSALGLLLGGTLRAEIVLALANIAWFVFIAVGGLVVAADRVPDGARWVARSLPSGALAEAMHQATHHSVDWIGFGVLLAWGVVAGVAATRLFRFT